MIEPTDERRKMILDALLHFVLTFVAVVLFSTLLEQAFAGGHQSVEQKSHLRMGLESFAPLEIVRFYNHALGWHESDLPGGSYLVGLPRTREYRECERSLPKDKSGAPSPVRIPVVTPYKQRWSWSLPELPGGRPTEDSRRADYGMAEVPKGDGTYETRIVPKGLTEVLIPWEQFCKNEALAERKKHFRFAALAPSFLGLKSLGALIDLGVYEFHTQAGWALFAVYAQLLFGFTLTAGALWHYRVRVHELPVGVVLGLLLPAAILVGSLAAAVLQLFSLGVIFGAWFTAPYKASEVVLHKVVDRWGGTIIRRLHPG